MTEDNKAFKQDFLDEAHYENLIEDMVGAYCFSGEIDDETSHEIFENVLNNYSLDDLYFNTFCSIFGGEENLKLYMKLEMMARQASDSFFNRLEDVLADELNPHLPEDRQIEKTRYH